MGWQKTASWARIWASAVEHVKNHFNTLQHQNNSTVHNCAHGNNFHNGGNFPFHSVPFRGNTIVGTFRSSSCANVVQVARVWICASGSLPNCAKGPRIFFKSKCVVSCRSRYHLPQIVSKTPLGSPAHVFTFPLALLGRILITFYRCEPHLLVLLQSVAFAQLGKGTDQLHVQSGRLGQYPDPTFGYPTKPGCYYWGCIFFGYWTSPHPSVIVPFELHRIDDPCSWCDWHCCWNTWWPLLLHVICSAMLR